MWGKQGKEIFATSNTKKDLLNEEYKNNRIATIQVAKALGKLNEAGGIMLGVQW